MPHLSLYLAFALAACCALCHGATAQEPPAGRFVQDRFLISFFGDPPRGEDMEARFAEIAEANFNVALVGDLSPSDNELLLQKLALCEKHGMAAIAFQLDVDPDKLVEAPNCWGYALRDEPGTADFPELAKLVQEVRRERPGRLALINLFPSYASPWGQLGAENYDEYVSRFVDEVGLDVLCMDHYPRFIPENGPAPGDGRDAYCSDLAVMRKYSQAKGVPFWNCFNALPYGHHTDPTEAQLRWQMFASAAYGARGLVYFCYWTPTFRHYDEAKRLNECFKALGPALMQLTSTRVLRVKPEDEPAAVLGDGPVHDLQRADHDPPHDFLVGEFRHTDGRRAVLLQNYHFAYTSWPTIVFNAPHGEVLEVSQVTGEATPVLDDSPSMDGLQLSFNAGEGRLFLLPAKDAGEAAAE